MKKNEVNNNIKELMDSGHWFWSEEFINPHINPILGELEASYNTLLDVVRETREQEIVDALLDLDIKRPVLMKLIMILTDTSAETLDRAAMYINYKGLSQLTLSNRAIKFIVLGPQYYRNLNNENIAKAEMNLAKDLLNILTFAYKSREFGLFETFKKCNLGLLAGNENALEIHLQFLLLRSNSQMKQLRAVDFGHQYEIYLKEHIKNLLLELDITSVSGKRYNGQQFDLVLQKGNKHVVIEIAFQETTNSTLERKGKQAKNGLYKTINDKGDKLIYIIDGAGYFKRNKALTDLVTYSHLCCNLSSKGIGKLKQFLITYFS